MRCISIWAALVLASSFSALHAQQPVVTGVVLGPDGKGIPGATVILAGRGGAGLQAVSETDAQGRFEIRGLAPAHYALAASKPGFVRDDRVRLALDPAADVWVGEEHVSPDPVVIRLAPQAIVGGTLLDDDGDPIEGALVYLYRYDRDGRSFRLVQRNGTRSDDRGRYRIASVLPGRYYIVAERIGRVMLGPNFYPGETDFTKAVPVDLEPGDNRLDLNIRLQVSRRLHIRGTVLDESGRPVPSAQVWAIPQGGAYEGVAASRLIYHKEVQADHNGRFDFGGTPLGGLPAGTYVLKALGYSTGSPAQERVPLMGATFAGVAAGTAAAYGSTTVTVAGADVEGVLLRLREPRTLTGNVQLEDGTPVPKVTISFQAERFSEAKLLGDFRAVSGPDGTFTFPDAWPAPLHVSVSDLPPGTYIASIAFGGQDLLKNWLDPTRGEGARITVVLSASAAVIEGEVVNGTKAGAAQVCALPKLPASIDDFACVFTNHQGRFTIRNLAPGDYDLAATEPVDIQMLRDPGFRQAILGNAVAVSLMKSARLAGLRVPVVAVGPALASPGR